MSDEVRRHKRTLVAEDVAGRKGSGEEAVAGAKLEGSGEETAAGEGGDSSPTSSQASANSQ